MKLASFRILLLAIVALAATGSYVASRWQHCPVSGETCSYQGCPITQALTEEFKTEAQQLSKIHRNERKQLGRYLLDPNTLDETIMEQADAVIEANNDLFRFVIKRLLNTGPALTSQQKQELFNYCGQIMEDAHHRPYTSGPHSISQDQDQGCPSCASKGKICDCTGLSSQLQLTQEQFDIASQANPNFAQEARDLGASVCRSHQQLVALLTDEGATRQAIEIQTDIFLQARSQLERRTVDYIIAMRPCLTPKQIRQLTGMCSR